jgi:hypothetical protein
MPAELLVLIIGLLAILIIFLLVRLAVTQIYIAGLKEGIRNNRLL